jgi:hypothetical protein
VLRRRAYQEPLAQAGDPDRLHPCRQVDAVPCHRPHLVAPIRCPARATRQYDRRKGRDQADDMSYSNKHVDPRDFAQCGPISSRRC